MQVYAIVGRFYIGIREVLEAVGKFILSLVTKAQPETNQAAKLKGG